MKIFLIILIILFALAASGQEQCQNLSPTHAKIFNEIWNDLKNEKNLNPFDCSKSNIALSFDDGPRFETTPLILEELKKRNQKAVFFVSTTHLVKSDKNYRSHNDILKSSLSQGHLIGSHGHEHENYDLRITENKIDEGYSLKEKQQQIALSTSLLNAATENQYSLQKELLFRFPYGRGAMPSSVELKEFERRGEYHFKGATYQEQLKEYRTMSSSLIALADQNYSHLGWNYDSGDSSFNETMPNEVILKKYIKNNIHMMCDGKSNLKVALFHDIKLANTIAIPLLLDIGKCLGVQFVSPNEMLKKKEGLESVGVFSDKDKIVKNALLASVLEMPKKSEINNNQNQCQQYIKLEDKKAVYGSNNGICKSSYFPDKQYKDCEGETSICYKGKWYSNDNQEIVNICSNRCFSQSSKQFYTSCEGEDSKCYNGKWYKKDDLVIQGNCQVGK